MSACNIVWRSQLYVQINLEKYLDSTVFSDVEFVVQSERYLLTRTIRAHKQFLAMRNDVFGTMFFGSLPEKDRVCITDLHPSGFYGLLKYLYSGTCEPDSFEEAIHIREAADKYLVPELVAVCSKYIEANMSPDKVCPLLDCLATTDIDRTDKAALQVLKNDALSVLNSESFIDSLDSTVESILKVISGVPESCIFLAIRKWAEEKCRKSLSSGETSLELPAVIRPFLPKLRFLALTPQEYVKGPGSWNVLEDQEDFAILRNIIVRGSVPLPSWVCTDDTARGLLLFKANPFETIDALTTVARKKSPAAEGNEKPK
ncbi:BTB/POZ domain-containing protein 6 [Dermacentor silvarum]|uniref:BTB/POZ domain-containing protein 6 n=1 Tax=Dermacentor silvarum TaxID=543639 RepID=UPI0018993E6E|nr:BTB/POZ domain-containing protein 6 [Dermacentor silvarum]